jgi:hypothetical protein
MLFVIVSKGFRPTLKVLNVTLTKGIKICQNKKKQRCFENPSVLLRRFSTVNSIYNTFGFYVSAE